MNHWGIIVALLAQKISKKNVAAVTVWGEKKQTTKTILILKALLRMELHVCHARSCHQSVQCKDVTANQSFTPDTPPREDKCQPPWHEMGQFWITVTLPPRVPSPSSKSSVIAVVFQEYTPQERWAASQLAMPCRDWFTLNLMSDCWGVPKIVRSWVNGSLALIVTAQSTNSAELALVFCPVDIKCRVNDSPSC